MENLSKKELWETLLAPLVHDCENCAHWGQIGCGRRVNRIQNGITLLERKYMTNEDNFRKPYISAYSSCLDSGENYWRKRTPPELHQHYWKWNGIK